MLKNAHTGPHWSAIYQKSSSLLSLSFSGCIASLPPVILIFSISLSRWNWLLHRTLSALLWRLRYNTFRSVLWKASCSIWWAMALGDIPTHRGLQSSKSDQSRFSEESSSEDPWKNCPYLKGTPALPPLDWEKPQHYKWWCDVWRMWFVSNGIIECHIENLKIEMGSWTPNCLRHHVWLDVSTLNKRLFTTKQRCFLLILICEASQIFVWRNKAFIFF